MITINYHKSYNAVTIEGHALTGEPGKDLVCCAVSTLANTLVENVRQLEAVGAVTECVADMVPGVADIRCRAARRYRNQVALIFQAVCLGFAGLAEQYPDAVRWNVYE